MYIKDWSQADVYFQLKQCQLLHWGGLFCFLCQRPNEVQSKHSEGTDLENAEPDPTWENSLLVSTTEKLHQFK